MRLSSSSNRPERRWTGADYELIREMRAAGLSWPAIGRELGERGWMGVYRRYQRLERRFGQAQSDSNESPTTPSRDG